MKKHKLESLYRTFIREKVVPIRAVHSLPPNGLTTIALFLGLSVPILLYFGFHYWAATSYLLAGFLDSIDGSIARYKCIDSRIGSFRDKVSDKIVDASALFGLVLISLSDRAVWGMLFLILINLGNMMNLLCTIDNPNEQKIGYYLTSTYFGRKETFLFLFLMMLLPAYFQILGIASLTLVSISNVILYISSIKRLKSRM